ncbi:hypothetical protein CFIMG_001229RA [Ceratocystis fimbriata CBS 114723]|uniref:Uncharacterized protein n=1 Tax=Ceratocystis fimbriata CBS 114723 TaxID=1035309 RepID=A0A2C5XD40_9PEZI|nr:hypothetical protein CFIMG_001229RA [Ceratocystis fimbriata CBS 114723]
MPRRLPPGWDRNETSDLKEKTGLPPLSDQEPIKRQHIAGDGSSKNAEQGDKQPLSLTPKISKKIDEVYMISGIGNDDMYCMVEDELYEVAKKFTAHLHEAEYQRLKSEAQSLDAGAGRKIVCPVVSSAMDSTEQRIECASRLEILRKATKKSHGNTEADADDDGMLDATLAGSPLHELMQYGSNMDGSLVNRSLQSSKNPVQPSSQPYSYGRILKVSRQNTGGLKKANQQRSVGAPKDGPQCKLQSSNLESLRSSNTPSSDLASWHSTPSVSSPPEQSSLPSPRSFRLSRASSRSRIAILSEDDDDDELCVSSPYPSSPRLSAPRRTKTGPVLSSILMAPTPRRTESYPKANEPSSPMRVAQKQERPQSVPATGPTVSPDSEDDDIFAELRRKRKAKTLERKASRVLGNPKSSSTGGKFNEA